MLGDFSQSVMPLFSTPRTPESIISLHHFVERTVSTSSIYLKDKHSVVAACFVNLFLILLLACTHFTIPVQASQRGLAGVVIETPDGVKIDTRDVDRHQAPLAQLLL